MTIIPAPGIIAMAQNACMSRSRVAMSNGRKVDQFSQMILNAHRKCPGLSSAWRKSLRHHPRPSLSHRPPHLQRRLLLKMVAAFPGRLALPTKIPVQPIPAVLEIAYQSRRVTESADLAHLSVGNPRQPLSFPVLLWTAMTIVRVPRTDGTGRGASMCP